MAELRPKNQKKKINFWAVTRPKSVESKNAEDVPPLLFKDLPTHQISATFAFKRSGKSKKLTFEKKSVSHGNGQKTGFTGPAPIFNSTPAFVTKNCTKKHKTYPHQKLLLRELQVIFCKFGHFPLMNGGSPVWV